MGPETTSLKQRRAAETDLRLMGTLIGFTARTLETESPVPFGALIVDTRAATPVARSVNVVRKENDPSSHAEVRAVRKACAKLGSTSLKGYTLYTTCEPCPMCMANALWAGLDRVVFAATIKDAAKHCKQIHIRAKEVNRRSDMPLVLDGPVARKDANQLFLHPNMQKAFKTWAPKKPRAEAAAKTSVKASSRLAAKTTAKTTTKTTADTAAKT